MTPGNQPAASELLVDNTRADLALRCLATFQMLLMLATWPLWFAPSRFPVVPLFSQSLPLLAIPVASVLLFLTCLAISLIRFPTAPTSSISGRQRLCSLALVAAVVPVICNQHCLQAWHWLFILAMLIAVTHTPEIRASQLRLTICTLYICSGLSRITANPQAGIAGLIARQLLEFLPGTPDHTADTVNLACHALSALEITTGIMLLFNSRRIRVPAVVLAVLMHASLLLALGPTGLNHHPGVLLWNLCFPILLPLLFLRGLPSAGKNHSFGAGGLLISVFSVSGLFALADNWPAWQLYSARPESWTLWVHRADTPELPLSLRPWLSSTVQDDWVPVRLDRLSLHQIGSPLYPEDRFQLAIISHTLQSLPETVRFRVTVEEPRPLDWWNRSVRLISNRADLEKEHEAFILNSRALHTSNQPPL